MSISYISNFHLYIKIFQPWILYTKHAQFFKRLDNLLFISLEKIWMCVYSPYILKLLLFIFENKYNFFARRKQIYLDFQTRESIMQLLTLRWTQTNESKFDKKKDQWVKDHYKNNGYFYFGLRAFHLRVALIFFFYQQVVLII